MNIFNKKMALDKTFPEKSAILNAVVRVFVIGISLKHEKMDTKIETKFLIIKSSFNLLILRSLINAFNPGSIYLLILVRLVSSISYLIGLI